MSLPLRTFLGLLCVLAACNSPAQSSESPSKPERADMIVATAEPVEAQVAQSRSEAIRDGRRLVVYVGAVWCEPCEFFLKALKAGGLPPSLADLRFLKFDHDADEQRLLEAGYGGEMIPRFVRPDALGRATVRRFEGSVKGPAAMENIVPRLEKILGP